MKDSIKIIGHGYFERRKKDGTKIDSWEVNNLVVTAGKVEVSKLLNGVDTTYFRAIAIGTNDAGLGVGNTTLGAEVARALATLSYEATAKAIFEKTFDFGSGESYAIVEAGIFNNSVSGGEMLDRFTFSAKNVDFDTDLYCKITITVA
jgi:hypothetical protein